MYNSRYSGFLARCSEQDIRRRHEESERDYRMLFENSADGIFEIDNTTNQFARVNPSLVEMLGRTESELKGMPFTDVIHPDDLDMVIDRRRRRLAGEQVPRRYSIKLQRKDSNDPIICDMTIHRTDNPQYILADIAAHIKVSVPRNT